LSLLDSCQADVRYLAGTGRGRQQRSDVSK